MRPLVLAHDLGVSIPTVLLLLRAFPSHGSHGLHMPFLILRGTFPTCFLSCLVHVLFLILRGTFPTCFLSCSDSRMFHVRVYKACSLGTYSPSNLLNFHPINPSLLSLCRLLLVCLKIYLVAWIVWSNTKQLKSLVHST